MSKKAQRLVEMALDLGGAPDWIDRQKKQKIAGHQHPYAQNPAFPREPGPGSYPQGEGEPRPGQIRSYAELVASDVYPKIVRKLQAALGGQLPRGGPMQILQMLQGALQRAIQFEQGHEQELEQAAIRVVLDLPEFKDAKSAYEDGQLKIVAQLRPEIDLEGTNMEPEAPDEEQEAELEVAQIAQELDLEKEKRRMVNMMIQGAAVNKDHAYMQIEQELRRMNPQLVNTYALLMSGGELAYWVLPEEMQMQAMGGGGGGGGAAGVEKLTFDEDGTPVITAQAVVFPVLIQELVKGLMEFYSYDDSADPSTQKYVHGQADTLGGELWDIKFGPAVWRQILRMIGNENQEYMPFIYRHLLELPTNEFNARMQQFLKGEPEGRQFIADLVAQIKAEHEGGGEQQPPEFGGEPPAPGLGGEPGAEPEGEDNADWWKKESKAQKIVKSLLDSDSDEKFRGEENELTRRKDAWGKKHGVKCTCNKPSHPDSNHSSVCALSKGFHKSLGE